MRSQYKSVQVLVFAAAVACGVSVYAVTPQISAGSGGAVDLQATGGTGDAGIGMLQAGVSDTDLLREAYASLAHADHDYKGRRGKAMKEVEAAGKDLGIKIKAHHGKHVYQGVSDDRLREARSLLDQVRNRFANSGNQRALKHVDSAIEHITAALAIR